MSEPLIKKVNKKSSTLARILIGTLVVAVVAALGFGVYKFISYKQSGGVSPLEASFAHVAISSPPQGVQLEVGDSVMVESSAIGSKPFLSMELWINGELLGVQAAPVGGVHPFSTFFSWRPVETGIYSLIAAAIDIDGNKEISEQVAVFVAQSESEIELVSSDLPTVLPAPTGGGYSPPVGPGADDPTGPASIWSPSVGDWVTSLTAEVKPAAPGLFVSAGECAAVLEINDLSDNEEGFVVYRQTPSEPMWTKVATLSANFEWPWFIYVEEGIAGAVTYYVTAFNNQGESQSNLVLVNIDPTDCAAENKMAAASTLGVILQIPNIKAELVYCYMSTDGINWARWPQLGFLTPDQEDSSIEGPIMQMMQNDIGGEPVSPLMDLYMECWGWQGEELQHLGKLGAKGIKPQENGNQNVLGEGITAEIVYEINKLPDLGDFYPMGVEIKWTGDFQMNPVQMQMGSLSATSPEIPRVYLSQTTDLDLCIKHLPPGTQNFIPLLYCQPYPEYNSSEAGSLPQPYLVWDFDFFEPTCVGGISEECKTYWELLELAEENGGQVGFTIMSLRGGIKTVWNITKPNFTAFVVPPLPCIGGTQFSVRMWYRPGNEGVGVSASPGDQISKIDEGGLSPAEVHYGPYSNWETTPCNSSGLPTASLIEKVQYIDVTFNSMELIDLDDDDTQFGEDVEMYGYFRVKAPSMGHWETEHCFFPQFGCDDDGYLAGTRRNLNIADWEVTVEGGPGNGGLQVFQFGLHNLNSVYLCQSTNYLNCSFEGHKTSYKQDNNTIRVFVKEGDALTFDVYLIDDDELSDNDTVCQVIQSTPHRSLSQWGDVQNEVYTLHSIDQGSGSCNIEVTISAVNP